MEPTTASKSCNRLQGALPAPETRRVTAIALGVLAGLAIFLTGMVTSMGNFHFTPMIGLTIMSTGFIVSLVAVVAYAILDHREMQGMGVALASAIFNQKMPGMGGVFSPLPSRPEPELMKGGLRNAGATCHLDSILFTIIQTPSFPLDGILESLPEDETRAQLKRIAELVRANVRVPIREVEELGKHIHKEYPELKGHKFNQFQHVDEEFVSVFGKVLQFEKTNRLLLRAAKGEGDDKVFTELHVDYISPVRKNEDKRVETLPQIDLQHFKQAIEYRLGEIHNNETAYKQKGNGRFEFPSCLPVWVNNRDIHAPSVPLPLEETINSPDGQTIRMNLQSVIYWTGKHYVSLVVSDEGWVMMDDLDSRNSLYETPPATTHLKPWMLFYGVEVVNEAVGSLVE